jgi:flagellar biosynthesis protein FliQ
VSIVTKRQKSTIVSGMVVGAVAEAMKGAVVVAEAVVVVGVVAGLGIMKAAGSLNRRKLSTTIRGVAVAVAVLVAEAVVATVAAVGWMV